MSWKSIRSARRLKPSRSFRPVLEELESRLVPSASVLTYHNDAGRDGANTSETVLTPANVNASTFGKQFTTPLDGIVYAQPLFVAGLNITVGPSRGLHDVVFVATEHDSLYAIDAVDGQILWKDSFLTGLPGASVVPVPGSVVGPGVGAEVGITGTPVIDASTQTLYLLTDTQETLSGNIHYIQRVHAVNIANGSETIAPAVVADTISNDNGQTYIYVSGPTVSGTGAGSVGGKVTYNALRQFQRAGLALSNGVVYIGMSAHDGDTGPYHGWVLGYNASNLALTAAFNTTPNGSDGGIWQSGGGIAVDAQGYLYVETGNGTFDGPGAKNDYGDSFIKLGVDGSTPTNQNGNGWGLKAVDYFTPYNQLSLEQNDADLGSAAPLILPDSVGSNAHPHLLVGAGKEGKIYLIDRDHMGEYNSGGTTDNVVQTLTGALAGADFSTPAFFNNTLYYVGINDHGKAFTIANGSAHITTTPTSQSPDTFGYPGSTPSISANGTASGIVWDLDQGTKQLRAYAAGNYGTELYTSAKAAGNRDAFGSLATFAVPTVANGRVFVGTTNSLVGFGILGTTSALTPAEQFVQNLYKNFLNRAGALSELDGWVNLIPTLDAGGVASRIEHSVEASQILATSYFQTFLGRSPVNNDDSSWVNTLEAGATQESVIDGILSSAEFAGRANALIGSSDANTNYVLALYELLLHRPGNGVSSGEVNGWLSELPTIGRSGVAGGFTGSQEFRSNAVRTFYGDPTLSVQPTEPFLPDLLHRNAAPSAGEVNGYASSPLDLFSIETAFASSDEYFNEP